ncbi:MAG: serine hydrolase, partial [Ignavibacteriales bacterium]
WPADVDRRAIEAATARAFADPEALTAAFLVVHRGRILAERYAPATSASPTTASSWCWSRAR